MLDAFTFGQLQDFLTLAKTLEQQGLTIEDLRAYVEARKQQDAEARAAAEAESKAFVAALPKCPDCQGPLSLAPANPEDPSEGSHWTCPKCRYGRYDERPPDQIHQGLIHKTEEELRRDKKRAKRRQTATAKRRAVKERCDGDHKTT